MKERFAALNDNECALLFEALLFSVDSATGIGFRSYDPGHPDYADGAAGRNPPRGGDTAQTNTLFQMLQELSLRLADHPVPLVYRDHGITTWEQFCQLARKAYESRPRNHSQYVPLYMRGEKSI